MNIQKRYVIAIDGPCGAGKTTAATGLADLLQICRLDTGAIFRGFAFHALRDGVNPDKLDIYEKRAIIEKALSDGLRFAYDENRGTQVFLRDDCISREIRTETVSDMASRISVYPEVRNAVLDIERELSGQYSLVAEGRDIGSVVFPDADVKFYLTADLEERAARRYFDNPTCYRSRAQATEDTRARDERDMNRETAPLIVPKGAIVIDNTALSLAETIELMQLFVKSRLRTQ